MELSGPVERADFEPLYGQGVRPDGSRLGTRFRTDKDAAAARATAWWATGDIDDPYARWNARFELRSASGKASVAAWDCTFSPVKSVSLLWAAGDDRIQAQVWAAHTTAVDAGLTYLESEAGYVRAGRNGVRVLDTSGLVVARMNEWTSRDGDPQLHTHCVVLNRAQTLDDGKWRALDGRPLLAAKPAAGAIYNRTLEAELTRRLGVGWRERPDGLREIDGIDDHLIDLFSTRRRTIGPALDRMIEDYRRQHGVDPDPLVAWRMAQHATLTTRQRKTGPDSGIADRWEQQARDGGRTLTNLTDAVTRHPTAGAPATAAGGDVEELIRRLAESDRATFTRHDLLRLALDVVPPAVLTPDNLRAEADQLVGLALSRPELLTVTAPDPITAPDALRRRDGTSVYERPDRQRFALRATLDREAWLLDVSREPTGLTATSTAIEVSSRVGRLGHDQAAALADVLGDERRVSMLVGPAGAGKTRTLRAVASTWRAEGRPIIGLTVSQAAADVLADEADLPTHNTAKWLHETRRGTWQMPAGTLVIIDEATMVGTDDLVEIVEQARLTSSRVLLVGDPAQLGAIAAGGAFELLANRHGAAELHEIRRFTEPWEADASLALRHRNPQAIAAYAMRARLHGGDLNDLAVELLDAWHADTLTPSHDGHRQQVLMIATTNEQAADLSAAARSRLLTAGLVSAGPTARLSDNVASVEDQILTRHNDRRLHTSNRGWVVNGDLWTVLEVYPDGAVDVRRHTDGATTTLPVDYLAAHCQLGYATTVHRAQGITVDRCHALITAECSHEALYVAATRGREANHLWVATDTDHRVPRRDEEATPEQLLTAILRRRDTTRLAAHQIIEKSQHEITSLARLGAIYEDAISTATEEWLQREVNRPVGRSGSVVDDPKWPSLVARIRNIALHGQDPEQLLDHAIRLAPLDDARSPAAVLHWRLGLLTNPYPAQVRRTWTPPVDSPHLDVARQAEDLIQQRLTMIRYALAHTTDVLPWAPSLGPRPSDRTHFEKWLDAATAITAYRERYDAPEHVSMLGDRPNDLRPDAQAAFDGGRALTDMYLATRLDLLSPAELRDLHVRQQKILGARPDFDPTALDHAHRAWERSRAIEVTVDAGQVRQRIILLEGQASRFEAWHHAATSARELLRQIDSRSRSSALTLTRR